MSLFGLEFLPYAETIVNFNHLKMLFLGMDTCIFFTTFALLSTFFRTIF
jgi:hypothetical protein